MNKITQYRPGCFEGFDTKINDFETLEELLNIPWVKRWSEDESFHCLAKGGEKLMAVLENGKKWWVVGMIENPDDIDLPKFKDVIDKT
jgi:hypothetical protein